MHKNPVTQAAGLMNLHTGSPARLLAMVCHGDEYAELPLMWKLCTTLTERNYSVTVLDGTKAESDENPGLEQVLDYRYWPAAQNGDDNQWRVLPARHGLQTLASRRGVGAAGLQWGRLLAPNGIVMVYASAESLIPLVTQTGVTPLLALSSAKTSLMTSYLALKRLLLNTRMVPTVVQIQDSAVASLGHTQAVARSLRDCAQHFLEVNIDIHALALDARRPGATAHLDALVQTLLEESVTLEAPWEASQRAAEGHGTQAFATRIY